MFNVPPLPLWQHQAGRTATVWDAIGQGQTPKNWPKMAKQTANIGTSLWDVVEAKRLITGDQ